MGSTDTDTEFVLGAVVLGMDADLARTMDAELTAATDRVAALCAQGRLEEASALADLLEADFAARYAPLGGTA